MSSDRRQSAVVAPHVEVEAILDRHSTGVIPAQLVVRTREGSQHHRAGSGVGIAGGRADQLLRRVTCGPAGIHLQGNHGICGDHARSGFGPHVAAIKAAEARSEQASDANAMSMSYEHDFSF